MTSSRTPRLAARGFALCTLLGLSGCSSGEEESSAAPDQDWLSVPADFPPMPVPADNELTRERAALGKRLFFDAGLSRTREVSCASCHLQEAAFADPNRFSVGVEGRLGTRNAPALVNAAWSTSFFWDGGIPSLELQSVGPIQNALEMDMTLESVAERLSADTDVVALFEAAYAEGPSEYTIPRAIASFVRTLISAESRYDHFRRGDRAALSASEQRGLAIFSGERGECFHCHIGANLAIDEFRNNGGARDDADTGRALITRRDIDVGKFKVPTLRNVAVTAPYMHDGSLATLEEVVEHYDAGGKGHPNTDPIVVPLGLTVDEKADLVSFLHSLTDEAFLRDPRFRSEL